MRSLRQIKKAIGHARIEAKPQADQAVLRHLLAELTTATSGSATSVTRFTWNAVVRSRAVHTAAAAVIVILLLIAVARPPRKNVPQGETSSAADLLTVVRLNAACRRGGLEAMEQQCEEAARRLGTRPERVSTQELIREFDGIPPSKG